MGRGRIPIVDDEESIREVLERFLQFRGYDTEQASGAHPALNRLNATRFDFVLSDVRMPAMSGIDETHAHSKRVGEYELKHLVFT